ncbi:ribonuclease H-like domain-containing protein [Tanacetum coccineum]
MRNTSNNEKADADYASNADHFILSENGSATQVEDTSLSEGNVSKNSSSSLSVPTHNLTFDSIDRVQSEPKRFSRIPKLPAKLNDYVVDSKVKYGLEKHVSYTKLNFVNFCFTTTLDKSVEPSNYYEVASDPKWIEAMNEEIDALYRNFTWAIVDLPKGKKAIGCKWLYKIKYKASGEIEMYKARLVAKGFSQKEDVYITLPLSFGDNNDNKVCKLNKSLYGLKQALRQCNAKLNAALIEHGFVQSKFDYSLFIKETGKVFVILLVYVDDIDITRNYKETKPAATPLPENVVLNSKENDCNNPYIQTPLPENVVLNSKENDHDKFLKNITEYQKLVVSLQSCIESFEVFERCSWKSVSGFVVMIGDCLISWKSKKQATISRSSVEAEYRCLAASTCEIIWICNVLGDLKITGLFLVKIFCDSSYAFQIASNQVFHEKIKHFEIDVHII